MHWLLQKTATLTWMVSWVAVRWRSRERSASAYIRSPALMLASSFGSSTSPATSFPAAALALLLAVFLACLSGD